MNPTTPPTTQTPPTKTKSRMSSTPFNAFAVLIMARQMNNVDLIEMLDSEYHNLQYLGTLLSECDSNDSYDEYDYILNAIDNTKDTIAIYKRILNNRYCEEYNEEQEKENLSILNNSSIPITPLD
jgi:hypothetical protein